MFADVNKRLNLLKYFKDLTHQTGVLQEKGLIFKRHKSVSLEAKLQKRKFINDYLKFDGVFILRMISMLTSELVGTEVLHELWTKRAVYEERRDTNAGSMKNRNENSRNSIGEDDSKLDLMKSEMRDSFKIHQRPTSLRNLGKAPVFMHSCSEPGTKAEVANIPTITEPRSSKFKKLIQKNFLTKPAHSHSNLMQINQYNSGPPINRAKQHRLSLSSARERLRSIEVEETAEEGGLGWKNRNRSSLRANSNSNSSPTTKTRLKRVVFATNVRHTVENCSDSSRDGEEALKHSLIEEKKKKSSDFNDIEE